MSPGVGRIPGVYEAYLRGYPQVESQRSIVEHFQFEIAARSKDMPLPIDLQGVGDSWRRKRTAFVAPQVTSRKPPAVTANMISDQK